MPPAGNTRGSYKLLKVIASALAFIISGVLSAHVWVVLVGGSVRASVLLF